MSRALAAIGCIVLFAQSVAQSAAIAQESALKPRVMALGDSITWGWTPLDQSGALGGYRGYLGSALEGKIEWVGRLVNGPQHAPRHEGWSGYQIRRLEHLQLANAMALQPDIVLLMLGTNDAWHPGEYDSLSTRENMVVNITAFLQKLYSLHPSAKVILSTTPNIWHEGNAAIIAYNQKLPTVVSQLQGEGHAIHLVDSYARVTPEDTSVDTDGIHPNALGYRHIAQAFMSDPWLRQLSRVHPHPVAVPEACAGASLLLPMLFARRARKMC